MNGDLFDYARSRRSDPATSKAAAASVDVTALEKRVLEALAVRPMTSHELAAYLCLELVTVSPRLRPLADKQLVADSDMRRLTPSGRKAIVWRATL